MYDPQSIQMIIGLVIVVFFLSFVLGLIYGLYLLAKIRTQAVRINKRLEEVLARVPSSPTGSGDKVSL